jgi:hypothetical protein
VQLFAVAELLVCAGRGDHPELVPRLYSLAAELLGETVDVIARRVSQTAS